jgi:hypothetical protein
MPKSAIVNHWANTFNLENIVVAAHTTWAHDYLCEVLEKCEDFAVNKTPDAVPTPAKATILEKSEASVVNKPPVAVLMSAKATSPYVGGEGATLAWRSQMYRNHYTSAGNFYALAFEGAAASNPREAAAFKVLSHHPALAVAPSSSMHKPTEVFSLTYADTGLFGINVTASDEHSKELLTNFVTALKSIAASGVAPSEVEKLVFKTHCLVDMSREAVVERLALTVAHGGCAFARLSEVTAADLKSAAAKALASNPTLVTYGCPPGMKRSEIGL